MTKSFIARPSKTASSLFFRTMRYLGSGLALMYFGCATVQLTPLPSLTQMSSPTTPQSTHKDIIFTIPKSQPNLAALKNGEDVTYARNFKVRNNVKVVINVPLDKRKDEDLRVDQESNKYKSKSESYDSEGYAGYGGSAYFSPLEQQIEKSLIIKGIVVLDRSKFEAKLRDRRSKKTFSHMSAMRQVEIDELERRRKNNEISQTEFMKERKKIAEEYQGREDSGAVKQHLVDMSELIRSARGDADYILQINKFDILPVSDHQVQLADIPEIQNAWKKVDGLKEAFQSQRRTKITQPGYYAELNAKMVDVKTGAIVWVGEFRVESRHVEAIEVRIATKKYIDNQVNVNAVTQNHNAKMNQLWRTAQQIKTQVERGSNNTNSLVQQYNSTRNKLLQLKDKQLQYPRWKYAYTISKPETTPSYPNNLVMRKLEKKLKNKQRYYKSNQTDELNKDISKKERVDRHKKKLVVMVSKLLLKTIPSVNDSY